MTNEIALATPWEMRAFKLAREKRGNLAMTTIKQTPDNDINQTSRIADYINSNEADILARNYVVPLSFPDGTPFLGGAAPAIQNTFWTSPPSQPVNSPEARHLFSLNTCNGCHARETDTEFTHIKPAPFGVPAGLSGYMTGIDVIDPSDGTTIRNFNEIASRTQDLELLVNTSCSN